MKSFVAKFTFALLLAGAAAIPGVSQTAKQDMKDAGHETKEAAKDAGSSVKKTTKKTAHRVKKTSKNVVNKGADATERGAAKVKDKTNQ